MNRRAYRAARRLLRDNGRAALRWLQHGSLRLRLLLGTLVSPVTFRAAGVLAKAKTKVEATYAGRAYAAYGGIYIVASIAWLGLVERVRPLSSDWLGVALCVLGASIILFGPRFTSS